MHAVIYCRVSTTEQVSNLSLPTQEKACREYCAKGGYEVDRVFIDAGESAKSTDRPEFMRMLSFCREHRSRVQAVVVYSLTRFSRNSADHHAITTLLRGLGITLRSVTEPIDESPSGKLMEGILAAMAQFDNDSKSQRVTAGMHAALERGRWVNRPPIGYKAGARGGPSLELDPERAPLVRDAFALCASGVRGRELIHQLTALGLRTSAGNQLTPQTLYMLLRNRAYLGYVRRPDGIGDQRGDFPALVDQETFARVQAAIAAAPTATRAIERHRNHPDFPLRRFARCAVCQRPLTGSSSKGRRKHYAFYHCPKGCTRVRAADLETQFLALMDSLRPNPAHWALLKGFIVEAWKERKRNAAKLAGALKSRIATLQARERRLDEAFLFEHSIDRETYAAQRDRIREEMLIAQLDVSDLKGRTRSVEEDLDYAHDVCIRARVLWVDAPSVARRQQVQWIMFPHGITVAAVRTTQEGRPNIEPVVTAVSCWSLFNLPEVAGGGVEDGAPSRVKLEPLMAWLGRIRALRLAA